MQKSTDGGDYANFSGNGLVANGTTKNITIEKKANEQYRIWANKFGIDNLTDVQVEVGTIATEFVRSKKHGDVNVSSDGTVTLEAKADGTTLISSAEGVTLSAEYNRDLYTAITNIEKALANS